MISILVVAGAYYGSAKLGLSLAFLHSNVSAVWPPSGLALAAVLLFGYRIWPGIMLGAFLANAFTPISLITAGAIAGGNTLEAVTGGYLLHRFGFNLALRRVTDITKFVIVALVCTVVSATIGNLALCLSHSANWPDFGNLWLTWWLGDAVGALIVTPFLIVWLGATGHPIFPRRYFEAVLVISLLVAASMATFTADTIIPLRYYPLARLTVPFFLYAAFRLGYPGVTLGTILVTVFATWGTTRGFGPLAGRGGNEALMVLQLFAGSNAATFLFLVAAIEDRRIIERNLRENQRRLAGNLAVTGILADSPDLQDAAPRILQSIGESLGWQAGTFWTVHPSGDSLHCFEVWRSPGVAIDDFERDTRVRQFRLGEGLPGRVWSTKSTAWISELAHDGNFPRAPMALKARLHSAFAFPLIYRDKFLGVMEFFTDEPREPDEATLAMFGSVGSQIGLFMERRQAETAVRELAAIVESAEDAVMGKDLQGYLTSWNASAQKLFGFRADEIVGQPIFRIVPQSLHDDELTILATLKRGESIAPFESIRLAKDGREINVSLTISPVRSADGVVIGASTIARDITDRIHAEKERELLLLRAQEARADAETANRLKDEFLASVSHELRTPVNAIVGWTGLMQAGLLDAGSQSQAIEIIDRNAKLQVRLIEDLLDVSRIVSGNIRFEPQPLRFHDAIEAAIDSVRPSVDAKHIALQVDLDRDMGSVLGDPDRLQQVVWNLLVNAVKFTQESGVVAVQLRPVVGNAELLISDNGEGIRADFLPYVFDRFRQADSTTTRRHRGIGIGLAIVHHLVELHQGTVMAESEGEGQGAAFRVTIPLINDVQAKLFDDQVLIEKEILADAERK
ncbi:MAG: MASE1 domain-containing protein [Pyrinomonadaceae bacterium]